jgi:hypothetical protein
VGAGLLVQDPMMIIFFTDMDCFGGRPLQEM